MTHLLTADQIPFGADVANTLKLTEKGLAADLPSDSDESVAEASSAQGAQLSGKKSPVEIALLGSAQPLQLLSQSEPLGFGSKLPSPRDEAEPVASQAPHSREVDQQGPSLQPPGAKVKGPRALKSISEQPAVASGTKVPLPYPVAKLQGK